MHTHTHTHTHKTCGKVQSCTAEGKIIHYGCARPLQREDLRVGFGNLLQTPVCFNTYTVRNTSPIWFCKEHSEEMKEKEEMHFVLLGTGCYFLICSGAPSGWGDESTKVRCSQDRKALWRTMREAQPGPEGPLEDDMCLCWGGKVGAGAGSGLQSPYSPANTSFTHCFQNFHSTVNNNAYPSKWWRNTWWELSLFFVVWFLRKLLNIFDSSLHFLKTLCNTKNRWGWGTHRLPPH